MIVRHHLAQYQRDCGYRVVEAPTSDEARKFLAEESLAIDVVLSAADIGSSMNGFKLASWIRGDHPGVARCAGWERRQGGRYRR